MGALTFDALLRSLKQGGRDERGAGKGEAAPDAVYYLHGDEYVLKDEAVQALVDRVLDAGARDFNFDQRSAGELDAEAFHSLVTRRRCSPPSGSWCSAESKTSGKPPRSARRWCATFRPPTRRRS